MQEADDLGGPGVDAGFHHYIFVALEDRNPISDRIHIFGENVNFERRTFSPLSTDAVNNYFLKSSIIMKFSHECVAF